MHPEYLAVYAIMQDRIRVAETRRAIRTARARRPDREPRTRTRQQRPTLRKAGEPA